jgi:non-ribosomal peptide synthetase component F
MLQGKLSPRERPTTIVRPSRGEWLRSAEDVNAHHQRFLTLLETLTATSMVQPISGIYLLTADERHQLLVDCNTTTIIPVPVTSQPVLFQAQVAHIPDAPAVVSDGITLTYTQLNATANHLARHAIDQGWAQKRRDIDRNPHFEETIFGSDAKLGSVAILAGEWYVQSVR